MTRPCSNTNHSQRRRGLAYRGFTLIEATIVLILMAILLSVALPALGPTEATRLKTAGEMLVADLRLARSLAVRDHSEFSLILTSYGWKIEHVGDGLTPQLPKPHLGGVGSGYEIDLRKVVGRDVGLNGVLATSGTTVSSVTFEGNGGTSAIQDTRFWVTLGDGNSARKIPLTVTAATGIVTAGGIENGLGG